MHIQLYRRHSREIERVAVTFNNCARGTCTKCKRSYTTQDREGVFQSTGPAAICLALQAVCSNSTRMKRSSSLSRTRLFFAKSGLHQMARTSELLLASSQQSGLTRVPASIRTYKNHALYGYMGGTYVNGRELIKPP